MLIVRVSTLGVAAAALLTFGLVARVAQSIAPNVRVLAYSRTRPLTAAEDRSKGAMLPPVTCMVQGASPYCLTIDGMGSDDLETFLSGCKWRDVEIDAVFAYFALHEVVVNGTRMTGPLPYDDITKDYVSLPRPSLSVCTDGPWTAYALGRFETEGGSFWPTLGGVFNDVSPHLPPKMGGGHYSFDSYFLGSVDRASRIVGFPPIHQHHFHFGFAYALPFVASKEYGDFLATRGRTVGVPPEIMSTHGENECHRDEGGPRCHVRLAPAGFAFMEASPLALANTFQDVRPVDAPQIVTWQIAAVRSVAHTNDTKRIAMYVLAAFGPPFAPRGTYVIRTDRDSVVWNTGLVSANVVLDAYMHAHVDNMYDCWLFMGGADAVFDDASQASSSFVKPDYAPGIVTSTQMNIKLRQLKPGAAPLACSYMHASRTEVLLVGNRPVRFQRKVRCPIVGRLREFVMVAFHSTPPDTPWNRPTVRMHAYVKLYVGANDSQPTYDAPH